MQKSRAPRLSLAATCNHIFRFDDCLRTRCIRRLIELRSLLLARFVKYRLLFFSGPFVRRKTCYTVKATERAILCSIRWNFSNFYGVRVLVRLGKSVVRGGDEKTDQRFRSDEFSSPPS